MKMNLAPPQARVKVSRRAFLASSAVIAGTGALVIGVRFRNVLHLTHSPERERSPFDAWIRIHRDNSSELVLAKSEIGQGVFTSLPMVLAEEAELDWSRVSIVQSDRSTGTGGSGSVRENYLPLRQTGAVVREAMIAAAAGRWSVPAAECFAQQSRVVHRPSGRTADFGSLIDHARRAPLPDPKKVPLKDPAKFTLLGTPVPHADIPAKSLGRAVFGLDVRPPGLVYAVVAQSPTLGGTLIDFDATDSLKVPGVMQVFEIQDKDRVRQVAVVAKSTWAAMQGRSALKARWSPGPNIGESSESLAAAMHAGFGKSPEWNWPNSGSGGSHAAPFKTIESVYEYPFITHAPIEPQNITVHVDGRRAEVWAPTQDGNGFRKTVAEQLGLPEDNVKMHVTFVGGGFGGRFNRAYVIQAAQIARRLNAPVQLVWPREDTISYDEFRQCGGQKLSGSLDANGNIVSLACHIVNTSVTVNWGMAAQEWEPPNLDPFLYSIPDVRYSYSQIHSAVPRGAWRSVSESFNGFVLESFIDELAHAAHVDPYQFRRRMLAAVAHPEQPFAPQDAVKSVAMQQQAAGMLAVLDLAAHKANWGTALPKGRGRGIACWRAYTSFIAQVAEVTMKKDGFHVDRIVSVVDCGQILNPHGLKAQIEGGFTMGLSAAMHEAITVKGSRVEQQNFDTYELLRMPDAPTLETYLVENHRDPGGAGELGVTLAAPIVANAVFAASGKRLKRLPFRLDMPAL